MLYNPNNIQRKLIYTALVVYWIILLMLTSLPSSSLPDIDISDKWEHFLAYAVLTILLTSALLVQEKSMYLKKSAFILAVLFAALYGLLDELHQMLIPGRNCSLLDWIADFTGALIGSIIVFYFYRREKIKKQG